MSKKKTKPVVEQDQKIKAAADKAPLALLPWRLIENLGLDEFPRALDGLAWVFEYGSRKYAPYNFAKAEPNHETALRYLSAYFRHMTKAKYELFDSESNLPHVDHAAACLIMLLAICYHNHETLERADASILLDARKHIFSVSSFFKYSGELIYRLEGDGSIFINFVKSLASATYYHFSDVEERHPAARSRGAEVERVA